tara:strand:+ start:824 stop:946 length:123 start_codon:yes stop_codon:yes gene_type:complete
MISVYMTERPQGYINNPVGQTRRATNRGTEWDYLSYAAWA